MEHEHDPLTYKVIGCAMEVHKVLGPGLLESTYRQCLARELAINDVSFKTEHPLAVDYKGIQLDCGYRLDFLVEDQLILELKSIDEIHPIHHAQILTYMKLARVSTGLLINLNTKILKDAIKRFKL